MKVLTAADNEEVFIRNYYHNLVFTHFLPSHYSESYYSAYQDIKE